MYGEKQWRQGPTLKKRFGRCQLFFQQCNLIQQSFIEAYVLQNIASSNPYSSSSRQNHKATIITRGYDNTTNTLTINETLRFEKVTPKLPQIHASMMDLRCYEEIKTTPPPKPKPVDWRLIEHESEDFQIARWAVLKTLQCAIDFCKTDDKKITPHSCFVGVKKAIVPIEAYFDRLAYYMFMNWEMLIQCALLIERLCITYCFPIRETTMHRTLFAIFLIVVKIRNEDHYGMDYYAKCGGINLKECLMLESNMLKTMHYDVTVVGDQGDVFIERIRQLLTAEGYDPSHP